LTFTVKSAVSVPQICSHGPDLWVAKCADFRPRGHGVECWLKPTHFAARRRHVPRGDHRQRDARVLRRIVPELFPGHCREASHARNELWKARQFTSKNGRLAKKREARNGRRGAGSGFAGSLTCVMIPPAPKPQPTDALVSRRLFPINTPSKADGSFKPRSAVSRPLAGTVEKTSSAACRANKGARRPPRRAREGVQGGSPECITTPPPPKPRGERSTYGAGWPSAAT